MYVVARCGSGRDVEVYCGPSVHGGRPLLFSIVHAVSARMAAELTLRKLFVGATRATMKLFLVASGRAAAALAPVTGVG